MIDLEKAKRYCRIDEDESDNLIEFFIEFSKEEIEKSTGVTSDTGGHTKIYEMAQLIIVADNYENRGSQDYEFKPNNSLSQLYIKLKYGGYDEKDTSQ